MAESVTVGLQYTRNLGNFENARVHIEVTSSIRDNEDYDGAVDRVYNFVETKLQEKVNAIEAELKG